MITATAVIRGRTTPAVNGIGKLFVLLLLSSRFTVHGSPAFALGKSEVGTSGAQFLKVQPGARPVGMGEAFTGVADDIQTIQWNPAGLARLQTPELTAMHMEYFQSIQFEHAAFAYPTKKSGTWGLSITNLHTDSIDRRTEDTDAADGTFGASDTAYWLSYAKMFGPRLSLGSNLKYVRQTLDSSRATAFAVDGGALYETGWHDLRVGAALQNFGTKVKFENEADPLPMTYRLGASAPLFTPHLRVATDILVPRDHSIGWAFGGEYRKPLGRGITASARSGYRTGQDVDGLKGVSAGGGLSIGRGSFDFAWVPFGDLGNSYRFGLHLKLGSPAEAPEEAPRLQKSAKAPALVADPFLDHLLSLQ